jgi:hypothetical protein
MERLVFFCLPMVARHWSALAEQARRGLSPLIGMM